MNAEIFKGILDIVSGVVPVVIFFFGIAAGYWMGRNSAERPLIQNTEPARADQGSTEEPEHGDIFKEALEEPIVDEKAVPTIIGDRRLPGGH